MRDYFSLGSTPAGEDCIQVGQPNYMDESTKECQRYIAQLRRQFGTEPIGTRFGIKTFPHDFGSYKEVVIYFDDEDEEAVHFAYKVEAECPEYWDEEPKHDYIQTMPNQP